MTLKGLDPRRWDLLQLLAAFEASIRQNSKDEASWNRLRNELYAEPKEVRAERRAAAAAGRQPAARTGGLSVADAEAMLAAMEAEDASFG